MAAKNLRSWLRRAPVPARVRVLTSDGDIKAYVMPEDGGRRFKAAEEALLSLDPVKLEALDGKDNILRVTDWGDGSKRAVDDEGEELSLEDMTSHDKRVVLISRLLLEASNGAADRHERAYAQGFEKICWLVDVVSQRLQGVEAMLMKLMAREYKRAQEGGEDGDSATQAVTSLLAQVVTQQHPQANGKVKE